MSTKRVKYNKTNISQLPNDKPAVYTILTEAGNPNYIGHAQRGRVPDRILEHLDEVPGATVKLEQFPTIADAKAKETKLIKRDQPKYNDQGK